MLINVDLSTSGCNSHGQNPLVPLMRRLQLEGNQIVSRDKAEFIIADHSFATDVPHMFSGEHFGWAATKALGFEMSDNKKVDFFVVKWYDGRTKAWNNQMWLGVPLIGLMNNNLSTPISTGCCGTFVQAAGLEQLFHHEELEALLDELNHSGFVSLGFSAEDGRPVCLDTGACNLASYNILEGIPSTLGGFLLNPLQHKLLESWSTALLVSRWPYPYQAPAGENPAIIDGLTEAVEKHFWLGEHQQFKNSIQTNSTLVGVSSAWGKTLFEANNRAVATSKNVEVAGSQYRTDAAYYTSLVWAKIKQIGIFDLEPIAQI